MIYPMILRVQHNGVKLFKQPKEGHIFTGFWLILYLNGSDFEVEEVQSPIRSHLPVSSQTQRNAPACPKPRTSTYRVNGSNCQPSPKSPVILQSSTAVLSPMRPAASPRSNPPATAQSPVPQAAATPEPARKMAATPEPARKMAATPAPARKMAATPEPARKMAVTPEFARKMAAATPEPARKMAATPEPARKMAAKPESPVMIAGMNIMDRAIPLEFTAPIISPDSPKPPLVPPSLPEPPLVPPSLPEPPLVPPSLPEPPLVPRPPEPELCPARPPEPELCSASPPESAPPSARPPEPAPHPALPRAGSTVNSPKKILGGGYSPVQPPELFTRPWPPEPPDPPWPPELFTRPWPPEPPDPPWPPELFTRPWPPEPPDPPWPPELSVRPWPPELPDPPWLPDLPWRLSLATMFLSRISLQGAHPPSPVVLLRCGTHLPGGGG
ncbi:Streptococcal surface protein A [Labeo rohita]|uniref:Streptococcal surface protein A n=1 Tax=Labeo rohita TaxID=84645 RepID=A0ABQ8L917_LABRO|nr:Streptococcal surface protein A [Labeo rohita]